MYARRAAARRQERLAFHSGRRMRHSSASSASHAGFGRVATDLGTCLPSKFRYPAIPVEVWVGPDGKANLTRGLGFYDQCSGDTFTVDIKVQECLRDRLSAWRWLVIDTCPQLTSDQYYVVSAVRPSSRMRAQRVAGLPKWTRTGCVGG
jgi:hypothetical protein